MNHITYGACFQGAYIVIRWMFILFWIIFIYEYFCDVQKSFRNVKLKFGRVLEVTWELLKPTILLEI